MWGALPGGLSLSSAGVVSGTPTNAGTFSFTVQATDSVSATATKLFTIETIHSTPTLAVVSHADGLFRLQVSGDSGTNYTIEASTNLIDWEPVFTTNSPAMPFSWTDPSASNASVRLYRVMQP